MSQTAPWQESQARLDAIRHRMHELPPRRQHELRLVEARNRMLAGALRSARRDLDELLAQDLPTDLRVRTLSLAANAAESTHDFDSAYRLLLDALELLPSVDEPQAHSQVFSRAYALFLRAGDHDRALDYARRSLAASEESGDVRRLCYDLIHLSNSLRVHPEYGIGYARDYLRQAREQCVAAADPVLIAVTENMYGQYLLDAGDLPEAIAQLEYAVERMRLSSFHVGALEARYFLLQAYVQAGRFESARQVADGLVDAFMEYDRLSDVIAVKQELLAIAETEDDFERAYEYQLAIDQLQEEQLNRQEGAAGLAYRRVSFDTRLANYDRLVAEGRLARERWLRNASAGGGFLLIFLGFAMFQRYRNWAQLNARVEQRNQELAGLGEIARSINIHSTAEGVYRVLLEGGMRLFGPVYRSEILTRDWRRREFRWVAIHGSNEDVLPLRGVPADELLTRYVQQARELAPGIHLQQGPALRPGFPARVARSTPRFTGMASEQQLVLTLAQDVTVEGVLVLAIPGNVDAAEAIDLDRMGRLRAHALVALARAHQLEELSQERVRAEQALKDMEQARTGLEEAIAESLKAAEAKGNFLAQVSHELRTPLNAINGFSQKLLKRLPASNSPKIHRYSSQIDTASRHLLSLIDELLDVSRLESGRMPVSIESVELLPLIEEVAGMVQPQYERAGNRLLLEMDQAPSRVQTDALKLRQILLNLVSNACRFTDDGCVRLCIREERVAGEDSSRLLIRVEDDGVGIAADEQERIFEPFSQSNRELDRRVGGVGLGLAVTRNLCALLGGEISVSSQPGEGATFSIDLPMQPTRSGFSSAIPEVIGDKIQRSDGQPLRVFMVEDNRINRELMSEFLTMEGMVVASAETAEAGLDAIPDWQPDVILMDMHLPGMQGDEAVRKLKQSPATSAIPVIAVSAFAGDAMRMRALEAGCAFYETKPVDFSILLNRIVSLAGKGQA
ncbi:ATP-binding protein [Natronospira bacteriovora]|uniref:histidine kinase n=1 Tax=Natronospira bacteriovora TaxID=3069753 RepID=A0ABU0W7R9_9GAMM|nr:ATP-binding protein [Natronospira sp. AB-CW4]MDQ2070085.1 ATP-binding protein [Natronospira sp. AB-CW4]